MGVQWIVYFVGAMSVLIMESRHGCTSYCHPGVMSDLRYCSTPAVINGSRAKPILVIAVAPVV